jgi:peptidoglycan/xylan/chitin deacetylase (PgdA/CDA1 family)
VNKRQTLLASAGVSAGVVGAGLVADSRRVGPPLATGGALALAAAYLAGTYAQNLPLFGTIARPARGERCRELSLTFDDGPDPRHTPAISRALAERGQQATFFVLGHAVRSHPELVRRLADDGHEIACHGDDHRLLAFASPRTIGLQISGWERAVENAIGRPGARLLRAPHGVRSPWLVAVARRRGYAVCGWDGSVFDTAEPGVAVIERRVVGLLRPGAVVLLHDGDGSGRGSSRAQTVASLDAVLDAVDAMGLRSVTLGSLIADRLPERPRSEGGRLGCHEGGALRSGSPDVIP